MRKDEHTRSGMAKDMLVVEDRPMDQAHLSGKALQ